MRQQRYALQTKNKINPQKINETGISNLPCKELKVVIIKMLNKLERRIDEQSENIKENIRMSQNLKSTISELKNTIKKVKSLNHVRLFATPSIAAHQASLSITNSQNSLKLTSIESVMPSSHLILGRPLLLLPPVPPSIRFFSNESTLRMRWPKY